jgi:hypothetical protein
VWDIFIGLRPSSISVELMIDKTRFKNDIILIFAITAHWYNQRLYSPGT